MTAKKKCALQLCHDYTIPYLDVARQYASLFEGTDYRVITVYLVGKQDADVVTQTASDDVFFLENRSKDLRGLKRKQINQVKSLCRQYDFEFAIGHRYKAMYILRHIKDLPVIGIHHSYGNYIRFMRRWFVNHHRHNLYLLGVSNAIRDDIRHALPQFPTDNIQTLYNRINVEQTQDHQLARTEAREHLGIPQDKYVFANVGRLHPDKDQRTLIDAFSKVTERLPDAILVILGKGRLEPVLKQQVRSLKLEQRVFLGVVHHAVNYYRAFDSFVLSSDHEPFGMVLLEAIIARLPILATNAGGAKEIVVNPNWLFEIGDTETLAELLLDIHALDDETIKTLNAQNMQWLQKKFTDEAARDAFWTLDFVRSFGRD